MAFHVMEVAMFFMAGIHLRRSHMLGWSAVGRRRAMRRNVAAANMSAMLLLFVFPTALLGAKGNSQREAYSYFNRQKLLHRILRADSKQLRNRCV